MPPMKPSKSKAAHPHNVTLQPGARTGKARRWAYGYDDLASLLGMTPASVRQKVYLGWEPTLGAICEAWYRRRKPACLGCLAGLVSIKLAE